MFYWIKQAFFILLFWELGQLLSFFSGGLYPGNVIGMLLLFLALLTGVLKKHHVAGVAKQLLKYMALFFLPLIVGLMSTYKIIMPNLMPIVAAFLISTIVVMAVVGLLEQFLENRWKK